MGILANENSIGGGNYLIERSLRFQSASSQYLNRTPASAGNRKTWTWSGWVKRGALTTSGTIFGLFQGYQDANNRSFIFLNNAGSEFGFTNSVAGVSSVVSTSAEYRDPSAWYHLMVAADTTQATAANRIKLYVNGSEITALRSAGYPSQNLDTFINNNTAHYLGNDFGAANRTFDGYLAEVNFIDGQALTPSSFGETDPLTGVWIAKRYTGTYGTNGFYLKFNDGTSTTTLGQDRSGNSNNWTLTNFTRSAGVSDCWMLDVPSGNGSPTATQPSSNYPVMNPLCSPNAPIFTLSSANLNFSSPASSGNGARMVCISTMALSTGKHYFEFTATNTNGTFGVSSELTTGSPYGAIYAIVANNTQSASGGPTYSGTTFTYTTNDVIGMAWDGTALTLGCYKNGTLIGTFSGFTAGITYFPQIAANLSTTSTTAIANFGQRSFAYTPPSGFRALCTANLP